MYTKKINKQLNYIFLKYNINNITVDITYSVI